MPNGFSNDVMFAANADFTKDPLGSVSENNGLVLDGELWIGRTTPNGNGAHIGVGNIISDGSIVPSYVDPNIKLVVNAAAAGAVTKLSPDTFTAPGTQPTLPDAFGVIGLTGAQTAPGTISSVIRTDSLNASVITIEIQQTSAVAAKDVTKNGVSHFDSAQFSNDQGFIHIIASPPPPGTVLTLSDTAGTQVSPTVGGNIQLVGQAGQINVVSTPGSNLLTFSIPGGATTTTLTPNAHTAPGTTPVVQDGTGTITVTGAQVAAGVVGTNIIRTDSLAANTMTIEIQRTAAVGASASVNNGVSHFDSVAFDVDANGFVQLNGGGIAATAFDVQANTAPGTDPVVPSAAGVVIVNGAAVANHSVVLETRSRAVNAYNLEVQYAAAAAATDATKSGVAHFNSAQFSVDANGFVSTVGTPTISFNVDANTPPGTNPVVPSAGGAVTITGGQISNAGLTNAIRINSLAANTFTIQIQQAGADSSSNPTKNGVAHFNNAQFTVDSTGFVSSIPSNSLLAGVSNLGMSYSASTFSICSANGSALSASNPGFVTMQSSTTPGLLKTYIITANQTFLDSTGASTITGNTFGVSTAVGVSWSNDMPFYVYAVSDSTEASISFMICRIPSGTISPIAANIGKTGSSIADTQGSFFALGNPTVANYAQQSCLAIGAFRMRSTNNVADWTVQTLSNGTVTFSGGETTQIMADGIGQFHEGTKFWQGYQTMGAVANSVFSGSGSPTFTSTHPISYRIDKSGQICINFSQGVFGGGTGSNVLTYQSVFNTDASIVGSGSTTTQILIPKVDDDSNDVTFAFVSDTFSRVALNSDMPAARSCRFFLSYQIQFL